MGFCLSESHGGEELTNPVISKPAFFGVGVKQRLHIILLVRYGATCMQITFVSSIILERLRSPLKLW